MMNGSKVEEEMEDIWEHSPLELVELRDKFVRLGIKTTYPWTPTEFYDNLFHPTAVRASVLQEVLKRLYSPTGFWSEDDSAEESFQKMLTALKHLDYETKADNLSGRGDLDDNLEFWSSLLDAPNHKRLQHTEQTKLVHISLSAEDIADNNNAARKASWEMVSFSEQKKEIHGDYAVGDGVSVRVDLKSPEISIFHHLQTQANFSTNIFALDRFDCLKTKTCGSQVGIASWDWLQRLEKLLVHFFSIIFDTTTDASNLLMEMMPREASEQIEEIFKLLLQADPEMYKELNHIVSIAEQWIVHWAGDSDKRSRAMEFVRLYLSGIKHKNYYKIPVQARVRQLGAFIAGMKTIEGGGFDVDFEKLESAGFSPMRISNMMSMRSHPPQLPPRPPSPRVKPATHFARVVANLLCDFPCAQPLTSAKVYADRLAKNVFAHPMHNDKVFQDYLDLIYGNRYKKIDIFKRELPPPVPVRPHSAPENRESFFDKIQSSDNKNCILPIFTKEYIKRLVNNGKGEEMCATSKMGLKKDKSQHSFRSLSDTDLLTKRGESRRGERNRAGRQRGQNNIFNKRAQGDRGFQKNVRDAATNPRSVSRLRPPPNAAGSGNIRVVGAVTVGVQSKSGQKTLGKSGVHSKQGDTNDQDYKTRPKGFRPVPGDPDYNSDDEWHHDDQGRRTKRKQSLKGGQRPAPDDPDYDSEEEWEHDKYGKRVKRRHDHPFYQNQSKYYGTSGQSQKQQGKYGSTHVQSYNVSTQHADTQRRDSPPHPGDPDYNSDDDWHHDENGKRTKRKRPLAHGRRPIPGDPDYVSDDEWEHDNTGQRTTRKKPLRGGQRPEPGDPDYDSEEEWEHDIYGERIKRRPHKREESQHEGMLPRHSRMKQSKAQMQEDENKAAKANRLTRARELGNRASRFNRMSMNKDGSRGHGRKSMYDDDEYMDHTRGGLNQSRMSRDKRLVHGYFRSQADLQESLRRSRMFTKSAAGRRQQSDTENDGAAVSTRASLSTPNMRARSKSMEMDKKRVKRLPKALKQQIARLHGVDVDASELEDFLDTDDIGDDGLDEVDATIWRRMIENSANYIHSGRSIGGDCSKKFGSSISLWGKLPLPPEKVLSQPPPQVTCCKSLAANLPSPASSKSVLIKDKTGALNSYTDIPGSLPKYKQIFRDVARTKKLPRPSTPEVTSRLIERTSKVLKKKMGAAAALEDAMKKLPDPSTDDPTANENSDDGKAEPPRRSSLDPKNQLQDGGSSSSGQAGQQGNSDSSAFPKDSKRRSLQDKKRQSQEVSNGSNEEMPETSQEKKKSSFIGPHVSKKRLSNMSGSGKGSGVIKTLKKSRSRNQSKGGGSQVVTPTDNETANSAGASNSSDVKLPRLSPNQKEAAPASPPTTSDPTKLPPLQTEEEMRSKEMLGMAEAMMKETTTTKEERSSRIPMPGSKAKKSPVVLEVTQIVAPQFKQNTTVLKYKTPEETYSNASLGQGDQMEVVTMNPCWEMASKLFKTPLKAPAIPIPDNLIIHIEKKYPSCQWPRGTPIALRYYPSGQPFCVVFKNGAGRVHYPHGGLAVAISAPAQSPTRVLAIRDPFDQFYFFDKAVMADLSCNGRGTTYDENGVIEMQYNADGGFRQIRQEGLGKLVQRWQWNSGGQRMIIKLNRYMALKIMDITKVYLVFYGNKRGVRLNVGAGRQVNLMSVACDSSKIMVSKDDKDFEGPVTATGTFDYARGRFPTPVLGYLDNAWNRKPAEELDADNDCDIPLYTYSFNQSDYDSNCLNQYKGHDCCCCDK